MIIHKIIKYKQKVHVSSGTSIVPVVHTPMVRVTQHQSTSLYLFDKFAYANFIRNLPFKKGDFVIPRSAEFPYKKEDVWKVEEIQELYWDCKDNKPGLVPKPIIVTNADKTERMYASANALIACPKELEF